MLIMWAAIQTERAAGLKSKAKLRYALGLSVLDEMPTLPGYICRKILLSSLVIDLKSHKARQFSLCFLRMPRDRCIYIYATHTFLTFVTFTPLNLM